jgi:hypothetical protein
VLVDAILIKIQGVLGVIRVGGVLAGSLRDELPACKREFRM